MNKTIYYGILMPFFILIFSSASSFAQKNKIEGLWFNEEKTAKIEIYKAKDDKYYGKIVWLKEPLENNKPKLDKNNSDKAKRENPLMGLFVLKGFKQDGAAGYEDGTIYDPKNGKTYSCKITYKNANLLHIRGYIGISLIGRTSEWTR